MLGWTNTAWLKFLIKNFVYGNYVKMSMYTFQWFFTKSLYMFQDSEVVCLNLLRFERINIDCIVHYLHA